MAFTQASAQAIIDAGGGMDLLHAFVYYGSLYIPCQDWKGVEVDDGKGGTKKEKKYVSRIGTEVFIEADYIKAKADSEWDGTETVWFYVPWDKINGIQMLDEKSRKKVKV